MPSVIVWDHSFSVGSALLDHQHRKIIQLSNALAANISTSSAEAEGNFHDTLHALAEYSREHFETEEQLLSAHGYPDLKDQQLDHLEYCKHVAELSFVAATAGITDKISLQRFIAKWWASHILVRDMDFRNLLVSRSAA